MKVTQLEKFRGTEVVVIKRGPAALTDQQGRCQHEQNDQDEFDLGRNFNAGLDAGHAASAGLRASLLRFRLVFKNIPFHA